MTGHRGERRAPVEVDPVRALLGAEQDGLLEYRGYAEGDRYEVVLAGRARKLPAAEVLGTVERLRAVAALRGEVTQVTDSGTWVVQVGGVQRRLPGDQVVDWAAGFAAASEGQGRKHAGADQLGQIRELLTNPSLADQCRMVLLGLKEGQEPVMSTQELADRVQPIRTKKTIVEALTFGKGLSTELADAMIAVFGWRWVVGAEKVGAEPVDGRRAGQLPQMPGLERLGRIVEADGRGWLRYVDEPGPNKARRARRYRLAVGRREYTVEAGSLSAWLDGVAAFHQGG